MLTWNKVGFQNKFSIKSRPVEETGKTLTWATCQWLVHEICNWNEKGFDIQGSCSRAAASKQGVNLTANAIIKSQMRQKNSANHLDNFIPKWACPPLPSTHKLAQPEFQTWRLASLNSQALMSPHEETVPMFSLSILYMKQSKPNSNTRI